MSVPAVLGGWEGQSILVNTEVLGLFFSPHYTCRTTLPSYKVFRSPEPLTLC